MLAILDGRSKQKENVETNITTESLSDAQMEGFLKPGTLTPDVMNQREGDTTDEVRSNISDSYYNFETNTSNLDSSSTNGQGHKSKRL